MQQQADSFGWWGPRNPLGLKLAFFQEDNRVETTLTCTEQHQGWPGYVHGGLLYAVLDEVMGRVGFTVDAWVMTGKLEIRHRASARIGEPLRVVANLTQDRGRAIEVQGVIQASDGTLLLEATGVYMRVPAEMRAQMEAQIGGG